MTIKSKIGYPLRVRVACQVSDVHLFSHIKSNFLLGVRGYAPSCLLELRDIVHERAQLGNGLGMGPVRYPLIIELLFGEGTQQESDAPIHGQLIDMTDL